MRRLAIHLLILGILAEVAPSFAQGLSQPVVDGLRKSVTAYNECILAQFKQRTTLQDGAGFEKALVRNTITACEAKATVVRATLVKIPGATKQKVDGQINELRSVAGAKLLAILALLLLASELPADTNR